MGKQQSISHSELEKKRVYVSVVIKFGEKEVTFIAGDFSGIVEGNEEDYEDQHEGHRYKC